MRTPTTTKRSSVKIAAIRANADGAILYRQEDDDEVQWDTPTMVETLSALPDVERIVVTEVTVTEFRYAKR